MSDIQATIDTILAQAQGDEALAARLKDDPAAVLTEHGIAVPEGITVHVHENTATDVHLILPGCATRELDDAELDAVAGGGSWWGSLLSTSG